MSILYSEADGVATIRLNRPEKKNAMLLAMRDELADLCERINDTDEVRAVVLTGAGTDFCAGADIGEMGKGGLNGSFYRASHMHKLIRGLGRVRKPMVGAIRGVAVGMGLSMALACDVVVASETARFAQIQRKIALPPDAGGIWFLTRYVGLAKAREMVLSGRMVPAAEALDLGMILKVVPDAELEAAALALAQDYAQGPTIAFGIAKKMFEQAPIMTLDQFMDYEGGVLPLAVQADDFKEGTLAFKEKRPARFVGT